MRLFKLRKIRMVPRFFVPRKVVSFYFQKGDFMNFIKKEPKIYIVFGKARSGKSIDNKLIREHYNSIGLKTLNLGYSDKLKNYIKNELVIYLLFH